MNAIKIALQTENPEWNPSKHRVNFNSIYAHNIHVLILRCGMK